MLNKLTRWIEKILSFNVGNVFKMDMNNKVADSIKDSSLIEYNKNNNTTNIIQPNFYIEILPSINATEVLKQAASLANQNVQLTATELQKLLKDNNITSEQVQQKLSKLDCVYTIAEANRIAYFADNTEKRRVLAKLIYEKLTSEDDLDSNALTRAIKAMETLTNSHLKLNAFLYILRSGYVEKIGSIEEFLKFYDKYISKLVDIPFDKIRDIGTAIIGHGCAVTYTFGAELKEFFDKQLQPYIDKLLTEQSIDEQEQNQRNIIKRLNELWEYSGLTSAWHTAVGQILAREYLHDILGLDIAEHKRG